MKALHLPTLAAAVVAAVVLLSLYHIVLGRKG